MPEPDNKRRKRGYRKRGELAITDSHIRPSGWYNEPLSYALDGTWPYSDDNEYLEPYETAANAFARFGVLVNA